jgi:hypothetical protein
MDGHKQKIKTVAEAKNMKICDTCTKKDDTKRFLRHL